MAEQKIKQLVRILNADIDGSLPLQQALRKIKGVSFSFAHAVCIVSKFDRKQPIGALDEKALKIIEDIFKNPGNAGIPKWLYNRQKDYDSGEDKHLTSTDIKLRKEFDIKRLMKIKSRRGMRHQAGLPLRGQRTKGHFRKGKALGVKKKGAKGKK